MQTQDSDLTGRSLLLPTDSREVKVGEYNAVADTLEIINDTIRFQGKASGLLGDGACSNNPRPQNVGRAQSPWLHGEEGISFPLNTHWLTEHRVPITHVEAGFQLLGWVTGICVRAGICV